ncbi:type II secretion system F family protein [Glutamicibacter sp. NPDC087344]|uniref:type II secretion system F family protein n=1 Tax=Glutamicibacter sp. NPDC087344 TaxID=3363994 RepID=UPI00381D54EA
MTALAVGALLLALLLWTHRQPGPYLVRGLNHTATHRETAEQKPAQHIEPIELVLDLGASLMDSGLPMIALLDALGQCIEQCSTLRTVARCLEMNMEWDRAWEPAPAWLNPLKRSLGFAYTTGAPASALLRNTAQLQRRERVQRVARCGAQFATKLVLPLGACALPAFIALGVVPLIIAQFPNLS